MMDIVRIQNVIYIQTLFYTWLGVLYVWKSKLSGLWVLYQIRYLADNSRVVWRAYERLEYFDGFGGEITIRTLRGEWQG